MAEHSTVSTSAVRPNEPARQVIATFDNYADARVAIVGRDLQYLEQVLGRLNYVGAPLRGAGSGALVGALIGWIFGLFNWIEPLISALVLAGYGLIFGGIVGTLIGLLIHALQRGQRDFHSVSGLRPKYYDVVADIEVADRALHILTTGNRKE
jgi:hypothetical protein